LKENLNTDDYKKYKVDHRSYIDRGIEHTPEIHMGKNAWHTEKNGQQTERGDRNEWIKIQNKEKEEAKARAEAIQKEREEAKQEQERQEKERVKREAKTIAEQTRFQKIKGNVNDIISGFKNRFLIRRHKPERDTISEKQKSDKPSYSDKMLRRERRRKAIVHAMNVVKERSKYVAERAKRIIPRHQPEKTHEHKHQQRIQQEKTQQATAEKTTRQRAHHTAQQAAERQATRKNTHQQTLARERSQQHDKGRER